MKYLSWLRRGITSPTERRLVRPGRKRVVAADRCGAEVQLLEQRVLLSGFSFAQFAVTDLVREHSAQVGPNAQGTLLPSGYTPAQIRHAYGFDQISFNGTAGDGAGTTIAIVDAYDDPNIANDLHQFDLAFGLPDPPNFTKVNQLGSTSNLPSLTQGGSRRSRWTSSGPTRSLRERIFCSSRPTATAYSDLFTAVNTARNYAGVNVVSMSWGGGEFSGETL